MEKILVTGSSGFIGGAYIRKILELDIHPIVMIDTQPCPEWQKELVDEGKLRYIQADIRDIAEYTNDLKDITTVVHFAAQPMVPISTEYPYYDFSVNVDGSMKLLEFARKSSVNHFLFSASGGTIYGEAEVFPTDEKQMLNPISNYGAAKAAFEMYLRSYASLYGMKTTSLRFGNIFGPGSTHGVIHDFYQKLRKNSSKMEILGDGTQTKSYLYIDDCTDGFLLAMNRDDDGFQAFNLSGDESVSVTKIAELVAVTLNVKPKFIYTGGDRGWKGDVRYGSLDTTKIKQLGWSNRTSFRKGVQIYIDWLKSTSVWK